MVSLSSARPTSGHSSDESSAGGGRGGHGSISTSLRTSAVPSRSRSVQFQRGQDVARSGGAAGIGLQPHLQHAFPQRQRNERGPEVHHRLTIGAADRQPGCGEQPPDTFFQSGQTRHGNGHLECVLAVEPWVRINLLRQDKSGGKLYFFTRSRIRERVVSAPHGGNW